jgi:NAD(P)-dependent dehydrogenase (short-subunit alcohol dehydrogenase family)
VLATLTAMGPNPDRQAVVLVTGASTGIGLALVKRLRALHCRVVATARESSMPRFEAAGVGEDERTIVRALDVTDYMAQQSILDEVGSLWGGIDVLVNNAGVAYSAVAEDMSADDELEVFRVNYFAPMNLIRLTAPYMRRRRYGHIINISSVGGMMAMPTMGSYNASKFALEGATESLWYELRPWGIRVSLIQPGFVHSAAFHNTRYTVDSGRSSEDANADYHSYYANMRPFIAGMMKRSSATPDRIARTIVRAMNQRHPKLRIPATVDAWVFYYLRRALPRRLYHFVLYRSLPNISTWVGGPRSPA